MFFNLFYSKRFLAASCVFLFAFALFAGVAARSGAADSDSLYMEADKAVRDSQRAMFNGKLEESFDLLKNAGELIERIKAADPEYAKLKGLESKYAKQAKDFERRLKDAGASESQSASKSAASTASPSSPPASEPAPLLVTAAPSVAKLPGGVTHRLQKVDKIIESADRVLNKNSAASNEWRVKELESVAAQAKGIMREIQNGYGEQAPSDHPEMKAREEKIAAFETKVAALSRGVTAEDEAAGQAEARKEELSAHWVAKLTPYAVGPYRTGYDETKYLAGAVADPAELARRKAIYEEASAVFAEYGKVEFPDGKSQELELLEKDLDYSLKSFAESHRSMSDSYFREARQKLDNASDWLEKETAADDGKNQPRILNKDLLPEIEGLIASSESAAPDDPRIPQMKTELAALKNKDSEIRKTRISRTFMTPDKFKGAELDAIKKQAAEALQKKFPQANALRTTVIGEDWKEERVVEYTDSTKTAVQYRVTGSVTAQIAAKNGDQVNLYTIYLGKDQRSDGSWGPLNSHVMFIDPMLEENIDK